MFAPNYLVPPTFRLLPKKGAPKKKKKKKHNAPPPPSARVDSTPRENKRKRVVGSSGRRACPRRGRPGCRSASPRSWRRWSAPRRSPRRATRRPKEQSDSSGPKARSYEAAARSSGVCYNRTYFPAFQVKPTCSMPFSPMCVCFKAPLWVPKTALWTRENQKNNTVCEVVSERARAAPGAVC